ncbi:hypothetical protein, partial [Novosphingobium sp.]|uniref:hypothetical protein n=1 Tax=Novosphingobium sp. TaxID=1874826 RepID=UPI00333F78CF
MVEQQSAHWRPADAMDHGGAARVSLLAFVNFAILLPTGVFQYGFGRLVMLAVFLLFLLTWLGWRHRLAVIEAWLFAKSWAVRAVLAGAIPLVVLVQSIPSPHKVRVVEAAVMLVLTTWLTADAGAVERRFGRMARLIPIMLVMLACAVPLLNLVSGLSVYKLSDVATTTVDAARLVWAGQNPYAAQIDVYGAINAHGPGYGGYKYLPLMIAVYLPFILPFGPNAVLWVDAATLAVLAALVWKLARAAGRTGVAAQSADR